MQEHYISKKQPNYDTLHQISRNSVITLQVHEYYIGKKKPNHEALTSHKSYIPSS